MKRTSLILAALLALPLPAAAMPQVGVVTTAEVDARHLAAYCGTGFFRAADFGPPRKHGLLFYAGEDKAIIRLDDAVVDLSSVATPGPTEPKIHRRVYANADQHVSALIEYHETWSEPDTENWRVAGTLTLTVKGDSQTFAVKGTGGC